jgi:hypothetical protein
LIIDSVISNIEKGRLGDNRGLFMGYPKLSEYIPGVQPSTIYNVGSNTGAGKTSFTMSSWVYNPFEDYLLRKAAGEDIKLKMFIFSMEMHSDILMTKGICRKLFKDYGIIVDVGYVLSRGKNRISQEVYDKVLSVRKYFEEFEEVATILGSDNPTGIAKLLKGYYLNNGKEERHPIQILEDGQPKIIQVFDRYIPNNPNTYTIVIFDHVSLTRSQQGMGVKQVIDKLTEYIVSFTNDYQQTSVIVQQLNRGNSATERIQTNNIDPRLDDFSSSSDVTFAAHYVITLTNPFMFELGNYRGYDIKKLQDRFRGLRIIKSRDGNSNIFLGLAYLGEIGVFSELKSADKMLPEDYTAITKIKKFQDLAII